jgi:hypothetical protein
LGHYWDSEEETYVDKEVEEPGLDHPELFDPGVV